MKPRLREIALREKKPRSSDWPSDAHIPDFLIGPPKPAAVLVPLAWFEDAWHVVYIRRAISDRDHHSGQVAFPGGRVEAQDKTSENAALREAHEEIGLQPRSACVLGRLPAYHTITNYRVVPVVATIDWPYVFDLAEDEVGRVFTIPLDWLADTSNYEVRPRDKVIPGKPVTVVYYRHYDGELLWGATARITLSLLDALVFDTD
ncbi:MAG: CoA pyrophosphatase [Gammaproteobacteria bacterium]|nr:CoA pyrophosphatase [Gammaproteobacteria bacterium]